MLSFNVTASIISLPIHERSEIIVPFEVKLREDSVVISREITNGVYLANTLVLKIGNQNIKLLNATDRTHNCKEP